MPPILPSRFWENYKRASPALHVFCGHNPVASKSSTTARPCSNLHGCG